MKDLFMIQNLVNVIYHTRDWKRKKKDIKLYQYIQKIFFKNIVLISVKKMFYKLRIEENFFNLIKAVLQNLQLTSYIIVNH